jgi:hypothetical protein
MSGVAGGIEESEGLAVDVDEHQVDGVGAVLELAERGVVGGRLGDGVAVGDEAVGEEAAGGLVGLSEQDAGAGAVHQGLRSVSPATSE